MMLMTTMVILKMLENVLTNFNLHHSRTSLENQYSRSRTLIEVILEKHALLHAYCTFINPYMAWKISFNNFVMLAESLLG